MARTPGFWSTIPKACSRTGTILWSAVGQIRRGADGRYPETGIDGKKRAALYAKSALIRFAARENLPLWTTTSSSAPEAVEKVRELVQDAGGKFGSVKTLDPGLDTVMTRLRVRNENGKWKISAGCRSALARWYGRRAVEARINERNL